MTLDDLIHQCSKHVGLHYLIMSAGQKDTELDHYSGARMAKLTYKVNIAEYKVRTLFVAFKDRSCPFTTESIV
jgi:hypothetical protein